MRPRVAISSTCWVASGLTRERIWSSASSTLSTPYSTARRTSERPQAWPSRWRPRINAQVGHVQHRLPAGEEPPPAQHEQGQEARRDENVTEPDGQGVRVRHRGKDDEDALQEDGHQAEHGHGDEGTVPLGRPARQPLEQIREGNEPAHDEHHPRQGLPGLNEQPPHEEARLDGNVPVPDHEVLGPEEIHPHHRHGELQLGHVLHGGGRDGGGTARVGAHGEDGQETERRVERAHREVAPKSPLYQRGPAT